MTAVLSHIKNAVDHLIYGQSTDDESAFTDAVYRTNQAFEGGLKEAYRVLTGIDPLSRGTTIHKVEEYFKQEGKLRSRVLEEFTRYRQGWRNPSTHDYRLDFDENEALLAIVTVSAFVIVLLDQMSEHIGFERAKTEAATSTVSEPTQTLTIETVAALMDAFLQQFNHSLNGRTAFRETEVIGALDGFLSSTVPTIRTEIEAQLHPERSERPDLLIITPSERFIIEVRLIRRHPKQEEEATVERVLRYMDAGNISHAIVLMLKVPNGGKVIREDRVRTNGSGGEIILLTSA